MKFRDRLKAAGACQDALNWVGNRSAQKAWEECPKCTWMWWLVLIAGSIKDYKIIDTCDARCTTNKGVIRAYRRKFPKCPRLKWPSI